MDNKPSLNEAHQELQEVYSSSSARMQPNADNSLSGKTIAKHLGLFLLTFALVSLVGANFVGFHGSTFPFSMPETTDIYRGALFAFLLLAFLGVHEFGHYFAAVYHKITVTLPYFIPIPIGIGTMGAVIRIKQKINDTRKLFDVGAAGPLSGFIVSITVLLIGFVTLPDASYIQQFDGHSSVKQHVTQYGTYPDAAPAQSAEPILTVGNTLLYGFLSSFFENVPPMWEMYHYPFLFAGWLGLFFTALNLMPLGQLDGGHILYSLIGYKKHQIVARIFFGLLVTMAGIEAIPFIYLSLSDYGYSSQLISWLIWAAILFILLRKAFHNNLTWLLPTMAISLAVAAGYLYLYLGNLTAMNSLIWLIWSFFTAYLVGIEHPPALYERPLDTKRTILGWLSMAIFVLCISPNPLYLM